MDKINANQINNTTYKMKRATEELAMNDWQIPFMLFELSSYAKSNEQQKQQHLTGLQLVAEMNNLLGEGNGEAPTDPACDCLIN